VKDPDTGKSKGCTVLSLSMLLVMIVMFIIGGSSSLSHCIYYVSSIVCGDVDVNNKIAYSVLFAAVNARAWCPGCAYISCFPNPWWSCDVTPQQCYTDQATGATFNCTAVDLETYNP
jgi:hypothetical protein